MTEENIREYESFLERSMSESRNEVAAVKNYIYQHYAEDLSLEILAEKVYLSSGYLSFIFKKETGMNLNRYIRVFRMKKAKELLKNYKYEGGRRSAKNVGFAKCVLIFAGASGNITDAVRNPTGKEQERMRKLYQIIKNMKYRHKLTLLLVGASLVPMTVLALYSHMRMSSFVRQREMEDMESILEQTRENIDSQVAVYTSLINYLTYSPDIEEIIKEKNMDNYTAYEQYTKVADPLLSVPKSYHEAIKQIQLFADSIRVEHEYTLVPLKKIQEEWWSKSIEEDVRIQWVVNEERKEVAAVRNIYDRKELEAVLCITLDYDKIFQP